MYYTAEQIIEMASRAEGFKEIPNDYWLAPIRINVEDQKPNKFNDVVNLMHGKRLVITTTCTTTPGLPALRGLFKRYNKLGAAVVSANIWFYKAFKYGLHSGRMKALREVKPIWTTRDGNMNDKAEEYGERFFGMWYTNFHASSWKWGGKIISKLVGLWSFGCIVCNNRAEYDQIITLTKEQDGVSMIILSEFSI